VSSDQVDEVDCGEKLSSLLSRDRAKPAWLSLGSSACSPAEAMEKSTDIIWVGQGIKVLNGKRVDIDLA